MTVSCKRIMPVYAVVLALVASISIASQEARAQAPSDGLAFGMTIGEVKAAMRKLGWSLHGSNREGDATVLVFAQKGESVHTCRTLTINQDGLVSTMTSVLFPLTVSGKTSAVTLYYQKRDSALVSWGRPSPVRYLLEFEEVEAWKHDNQTHVVCVQKVLDPLSNSGRHVWATMVLHVRGADW